VEETVEEEESPSLDDEATEADEAVEIGELASDIIAEVEEDHSALLASLGADLEFLHGDNMSFYQANKAYYEDQNYEEAITEFQASIEYEKSQSSDHPDVEKSKSLAESAEPTPPNDVLCKSLYWMAEAYLKLDQIDKAVEAFGQLSDHYNLHYLAPAAQRRVAALRFDEESESA
jgi:TolA-binding protein